MRDGDNTKTLLTSAHSMRSNAFTVCKSTLFPDGTSKDIIM